MITVSLYHALIAFFIVLTVGIVSFNFLKKIDMQDKAPIITIATACAVLVFTVILHCSN